MERAIRQAIKEPESSCATRPTLISCESNVNMFYIAKQSLQLK